ncbi:hypothetical protein D9758_009635 [Tetrapyrgos nigripes]|uniref:HD/PDEase domain-containing protein n=1 Tax=Tetrapyrgos nigripes TaxID=182062 RepID=A0A8H5GCX8_9AGAR|nr:hypothetical protein D9758_009635 [Tetrapyrgos nigripes]
MEYNSNFTLSIPGTSPERRSRFIRDPIHDLIYISPNLCRFIDTKQFQRLRHIKQLGTTYWVWGGASHNRFEHCIGVAHIARVLVEHLRKHQPELKITDRDVDCVQIAGLCHDLGHGPWSHVWDGQFIPTALPGETWTHEEGSEIMFRSLIEENHIPLEDDDITFILALIRGDRDRVGLEKKFLFDVVANKESGLDVDKLEYIQRDSHMLGDPISINISRILESARVIDDHICFDWKDLSKIYNIFESRFHLHERYYNHKTAKAIEYMIIDALLLAEPVLHFAKDIRDPKRYLHLTDALFQRIQQSEDPGLAPAQSILDRIETRDLYKCVDQHFIEWPKRDLVKEVTAESIVNACKEIFNLEPDAFPGIDLGQLETQDAIVEQTLIHYGKKDKNPIDFELALCKVALPGQSSTVKPRYFAEVIQRVYTKESQYFALVQQGYRAVMASLDFETEIPSSGTFDAVQNPSTSPRRPSETESDAGANPLRSLRKSTSFADNPFTKVPGDYMPDSPSRGNVERMSPAKSSGKDIGDEGSSITQDSKAQDGRNEAGFRWS